jgi:hypothetical protein
MSQVLLVHGFHNVRSSEAIGGRELKANECFSFQKQMK